MFTHHISMADIDGKIEVYIGVAPRAVDELVPLDMIMMGIREMLDDPEFVRRAFLIGEAATRAFLSPYKN